MKRRIGICLALIFVGALIFLFAQTPRQANLIDPQFHPGEVVGGFRLAVGLDEANGVLHCRIQNATTNPLNYSLFAVGYFENVKIDIQGSTNMVLVGGVVFPPAFGYANAEPYFPLKIDAGGIITKTYWKGGYSPGHVWSLWQYLKASRFHPGLAIASRQLAQRLVDRDSLLWKACQDDTYVLDLSKVAWPTNLSSQGALQVQISQRLVTIGGGGRFGGGAGGDTNLYSPPFTVTSAQVRSWAKRNPFK